LEKLKKMLLCASGAAFVAGVLMLAGRAVEPEAGAVPGNAPVDARGYLKTGKSRFAFDHLGNVGEQLESALACGCTGIYATGLGARSYFGLPSKADLAGHLDHLKDYNRRAHERGVRIVFGYLCATSIVNIEDFAKNWDDYFPGRPEDFEPGRMLQQDIEGKDLPSWYGGSYAPADMWNPHWRTYEKHALKLTIEAGHDGVFFDNPTVHPNGNYSRNAMRAWKRFLGENGIKRETADLPALRALTRKHPGLWMRFRATEAADFIREMREYASSLKPGFIVTCNNSLNSWDGFYAQARTHGYSIPELTRWEDLVLIEDMANQPRREGDGHISYAQTLRMLPAISRGKPINICTLVSGDYTTPPNLMKLAIAECAAHDASYVVWSCWDPAHRSRLEKSVKPYHDFLDLNADMLGESAPVSDVVLIWPYARWIEREDCPTAYAAREMSSLNIQYDVVTEADLSPGRLAGYRAAVYADAEGLLAPGTQAMLEAYRRKGGRVITLTLEKENGTCPGESRAALAAAIRNPSAVVQSPAGVRVTTRAWGTKHLMHVYNLNVTKKDSYHDEATAAGQVQISWLLPSGAGVVRRLTCLTPDPEGTNGRIAFKKALVDGRQVLSFQVPELRIWSVIVAD